MHETQCDVDAWIAVTSVLMQNSISHITLFVFPAIFQAMSVGSKPRLAYTATMRCVWFFLNLGIVLSLDNMCNIEHEMAASSPKVYFRAWDGALPLGLSSSTGHCGETGGRNLDLE